MSNPWLKKNPFMSAWLSGANKVAGSMRGQATAEAKRQMATATKNATNDLLSIWTGGSIPASSTARKKKPKRR